MARNEWFRAVDLSLAAGRRTAEASALITCKNGDARWFVVTAQVRSETIPNMHLVTFRDIHDLKVASDQHLLISQTDQLTRISNRWAGERRLKAEIERFNRSGVPFSLIMCDVDHFKSINDQAGHVQGDHVLRNVAEVLRSTCRGFGEVIRWGGDEFLLVLPAIGLDGAIALAERLRQTVSSASNGWGHLPLRPTLSLGCAVSTQGQSIVDLLTAVDRALYVAKRRGRDRVGYHADR